MLTILHPIFGFLWALVSAEEESLMGQATVTDFDILTSWTWDRQYLIGNGFKKHSATTTTDLSGDGSKELQTDMGAIVAIHTVFIGNNCYTYNTHKWLGHSQLWLGNDSN